MTLDEMISGLYELQELAPPERAFVNRMLRKVDGYAPAEAEEIRRLYREHFGHLEKIKGERIDIPAGLEEIGDGY